MKIFERLKTMIIKDVIINYNIIDKFSFINIEERSKKTEINVSTHDQVLNELRQKLLKHNLSINILDTKYFNILNTEDIRVLISYDIHKLKYYLYFIEKMHKKYEFILNTDEIKLIKICSILFNIKSIKMMERLVNLFLDTDLFTFSNVLDFIYAYVEIKEVYKLEVIDEIIRISKSKIDLRKILMNVNNAINKRQIECLKGLFLSIDDVELLDSLIDVVLKNPKNKYLFYIIELIKKANLKNIPNYLDLINILLKSVNIEQANIILKLITNKDMLHSKTFETTLNLIKSERNLDSLSYVKILLDKKTSITDSLFNEILANIILSKEKFQKKAILSLVDIPNINDNDYSIKLVISKIMKCNLEFQAKFVLSLYNENLCVNEELIDLITRSNYEFQADCLIKSYNIKSHKKEVFEKILNISNELVCKHISSFLKIKNIPEHLFGLLFNSFISLKYEYQINSFIRILSIEDIFSYKLNIKNYIEKGNKEQLIAFTILMIDKKVFKDIKQLLLVDYLFKYSDSMHVNLIGKILYNFDKLGEEKVRSLIELIDKYNDRFIDIYDIVVESINNGIVCLGSMSCCRMNKYILDQIDESKRIKFLKNKI